MKVTNLCVRIEFVCTPNDTQIWYQWPHVFVGYDFCYI